MTAKENQSVQDATVQKLGTLEAMIDFCLVNDFSITDDLQANQPFVLPDTLKKIADVADHFAEKEIELTTGYPLVEDLPDGIGYMIINSTFIVT